MRRPMVWWCSGPVVSFVVGFCLGVAEIVFVFHCRTFYCSQGSARLAMTKQRSRDTRISLRNKSQFEQKHGLGNTFLDEQPIKRKDRILCWVMTQEKNLKTQTQMIKETWGRRCDITLYFSSKTNKSFPTIGLNVPDGRRHLFVKTTSAFKYIHKHHLHDAEWFLKADDDTYIIVENMRGFLQDKNTSAPVYYGQIFHRLVEGGYNSGGAGYVLSKEALKRFVVEGPTKPACQRKKGAEDVAIGRCLRLLGVIAQSTKDSHEKERFNWNNGFVVMSGMVPEWAARYTHTNMVLTDASKHIQKYLLATSVIHLPIWKFAWSNSTTLNRVILQFRFTI